MKLQITGFSGSEFSFPAPSLSNRAIVVNVGPDGILSTHARTNIILDGEGNELRVVEVEGIAGQPDEQFFAFDEIPDELQQFAVEVGDELVVPARYVRGVHVQTVQVELNAALAQDLLNDTSIGSMVRPVAAEAGDEEE